MRATKEERQKIADLFEEAMVERPSGSGKTFILAYVMASSGLTPERQSTILDVLNSADRGDE